MNKNNLAEKVIAPERIAIGFLIAGLILFLGSPTIYCLIFIKSTRPDRLDPPVIWFILWLIGILLETIGIHLIDPSGGGYSGDGHDGEGM